MWCRVALLLSVIFTLSTAYNFSNQEEFDRYSEQVAKRFYEVHSEYVRTGEISQELRQFYQEFKFPDDLRYREISEYPTDFSVSSERVINIS